MISKKVTEILKMSVFQELVNVLKDKNLHISAAESCTGGLFASEIVAISGASDVLCSSYITYSAKSKVDILGVNRNTIDEFSVVSENVAIEMVKGVCRISDADIGVSFTGYAGPASSPDDHTAGTVCFAFSVNGKTISSTKHFGDIGRNAVRNISVLYAAETLLTLIDKFYN